jgi:chorismate mutase
MSDEKTVDLAKMLGNIEQELVNAQGSYENAIKQYQIFRNKYVDSVVAYDKKLAEEVCRIKEQNDGKVTNAKEMAKGNCSDLQKEMLNLETKWKYYNKLVDGLNERIQTIKFLGRIKYGNLLNK